MYVENANGTSRWSAPKGYTSWLEYWKAYKGDVTYCKADGCLGKDLVGAHVRKAYSLTDQHLYIVPLCKSCNQRTDIFKVPDDALLPVPSNL